MSDADDKTPVSPTSQKGDDTPTITPDRWLRMRKVFEHAITLEFADQEAYLKKACAGDTTLLSQVQSLLHSSEQETIQADHLGEVTATETKPNSVQLGKQIGPYRLTAELGAGGMGAVYLAERADEAYQKKVALKVIRAGLGTIEAQKRFRVERQILANLEHPNIARLLDGGTTSDGLPYLVMEFIDGVPLDEYCNQRFVSISKRIDLFRQICNAVQFAHSNLIVHRDLKPQNILVGEDGVPKLLDFGIAKLIDSESPQMVQTRVDVRVMTPQYASPEQIKGQPVTTASDVYALGVILFELLTGNKPYSVQSTQLVALERAILETEPTRPSLAINKTTSPDGKARRIVNPQIVGQQRNISPEKLKKTLKGDLDNIILMALRKEPERRYRSVEQFSDDLGHYLNNRPVIARPTSWDYRARKFIQRNILAVIASIGVVLLITVIVGFYTQRLTEERNVAQNEAAKAHAVSDFLRDMLTSVDPDKAQGKEVSVREVLDEAATQLAQADNPIRQQPVVEALIRETLGFTYHKLGEFHASVNHREQAFRLRLQSLGEDHVETLRSQHNLASIYNAIGRFQDAEQLLLDTLKSQQRLLGPEHQDTLNSISKLGIVYSFGLGQHDKAAPLFEQVLEIRKRILGQNHVMTLESMNLLAICYYYQGRYDEVEPLWGEVLKLRLRELGKHHPDTIQSMNNMALLHMALRQYPQAKQLFQQSLDGMAYVYGADHPDTLSAINNLANLYTRLGQFESARDLHQKNYNARRRVLGEKHHDTLMTLTNLALVVRNQGDLFEAEKLFIQALDLVKKSRGEDHHETLRTMNELANTYLLKSQYQQSESLYLDVLEKRTKVLGSDHLDTLLTKSELAQLYFRQKKYDKALDWYLPTLNTMEKTLGPEHYTVTINKAGLANVYTAIKKYEKAESLFQHALTLLEQSSTEPDPNLAELLLDYSKLLRLTDRSPLADEMEARADTIRQQLGN